LTLITTVIHDVGYIANVNNEPVFGSMIRFYVNFISPGRQHKIQQLQVG